MLSKVETKGMLHTCKSKSCGYTGEPKNAELHGTFDALGGTGLRTKVTVECPSCKNWQWHNPPPDPSLTTERRPTSALHPRSGQARLMAARESPWGSPGAINANDLMHGDRGHQSGDGGGSSGAAGGSHICEYCDKPATHISRDSGEALCKGCGTSQYDSPKESLAKLTPKTMKMYGRG